MADLETARSGRSSSGKSKRSGSGKGRKGKHQGSTPGPEAVAEDLEARPAGTGATTEMDVVLFNDR